MDARPYQAEAVDAAFTDWRRGCRGTLFVCPTGGGKSFVFSKIAERHVKEGGKRVLVLADREWLVTQARDNIAAHTKLSHGIEMACERVDREKPPSVVCASVQSMARRYEEFPAAAFDLIVIDEADLAMAPSYRVLVDYFGAARIFGCTATAERGDGRALGEMFQGVSLDVDIRDLIDTGYLCRVRQWPVRVLDLSRVKIGDDDLDEASLEKILLEEKHLHEVVKPTMELAGDRPTLVFGTTVAHAKALAALFNRYRPGSARAVHGKMRRDDRRAEVTGFLARKFQFLCNCNLILRGVDIPPISCVAMARPTQSRTLYVQGMGRGTRLFEGKKDLLVLDFTDGADSFSLVSAVDVLGGRATEEEKERAREIVEENPGEDVSDALEQATADLASDATIRERVLARVRYRTREIGIKDPFNWKAQPLGEVPDEEIAKRIGTTPATVACARHRLGITLRKHVAAA